MKLLLILTNLLTTSTAYRAVRNPPCREDETHLECASACYPTCETFDNPAGFCTQQCVIGCHCKEGLLRAESGACVPETECED
ncbi:hypothetical protein BDW59DRAFT_137805 [Aspergillus cavernicola]|uniref:TIL domain-containing protein n=1 Tax=Aspergillus cavernicola TaxID=176166 RepID=A0ABR4J370_9EURO